MATTYRFAASPEACSEILEWFRALAAPPAVTLTDWDAALHFKDFGEIKYRSDGSIDADASPLATVSNRPSCGCAKELTDEDAPPAFTSRQLNVSKPLKHKKVRW